jgi:hypothetical protein
MRRGGGWPQRRGKEGAFRKGNEARLESPLAGQGSLLFDKEPQHQFCQPRSRFSKLELRAGPGRQPGCWETTFEVCLIEQVFPTSEETKGAGFR